MTRIIPETLNKKLKKEYRLRFFTALFFVLSIIVLINIIFVSSSYLLLYLYEKAYAVNSLNSNDESVRLDSQIKEKTEDLYTLSKKIKTSEEISGVEVAEKIFSHTDSNISIQALEVIEGSKITLRGEANSREDLILLQENIQKDSHFKDFFIPIETFAKQKDIVFNVTFTYHEN